jgi:hypothetical protein
MKIVLSPTIKHDTTESRERKKTLILLFNSVIDFSFAAVWLWKLLYRRY